MRNDCIGPIATALVFALASRANAHNASGTWTYPPACCKGTVVGGDCHRIPDWSVKEGRNGYIVRLYPGDHPYVTKRHIFLVPYGNEIPSGDGDFHACLPPSEEYLNCFFAPPSGT